jgi:predicted amidohydrolase
VLAPNQTGTGQGNVKTYGNSMIIDPWGNIMARASESDEEIIYATLDFDYLNSIRSKMPI